MEGSGRKQRVYLINGKRLVKGDPNLVSKDEIMLIPVIGEDGKTRYILRDNKGNILSTDGKEDGGGGL